MSEDKEKKVELQEVAQRFRKICNRMIEDLEDHLPYVNNLIDRDLLLKEIDALNELVDNSNKEAEILIKEYYRRRDEDKS
tara:strand:- start:150 stop:389 length:240 start_codon:yes stop_codon:yes gene_type:complete